MSSTHNTHSTRIRYARYVALGDSQTEGVGDGDDTTGLRGWADRLAEQLAHHDTGLRYANLAVRGRLAGQVRSEQLAPALALRPDLATVVA
ncbi:GDSL-type esterase/lipase family protein, partial [Streptomyces bobili]